MRILLKTVLISLSFIFFVGCANTNISNTTKAQQNLSLEVGLYPYVPRLDQFKETILKQWNAKYPNVKLNFNTDWSGGYSGEPTNLDVFVFDAAYLDDYMNKKYLLPLEKRDIDDFSDLLPYATQGVKADNADVYFGIPQIGCGTLLFYRKNDLELKKAKTLTQITNTLGQCTYDTLIPPKGTGLMMDFSSGTTNGDFYLEATQDIYGKYTTNPPKAPRKDLLDPWPINNIAQLLETTSVKNSLDKKVNRAKLFEQGYGRAYVGYSESMSSLDQETRDKIEFKYLPFSDNNNVHLFYSDIAGINPRVVSSNMKAYAIELVNLLTSSETFVEATKATTQDPVAQYLLPVRFSTFKELSKDYPLYTKLFKLVKENDPKLFRLGVGANQWLSDNKDVITNQIFNQNQCVQ